MDQKTLSPKEKYIHRDLSWLAFNGRVLEEALDQDNPLLERCRFLAIFCNNLDEFFMVRVAGLKRLIDSGYNKPDAFGYDPQELYSALKERIVGLEATLSETYSSKIRKELEKQKIVFLKSEELTPEQKKFCNKYFDTSLFPIITPMAVDQGHPFPVLPSRTIAFAVSLTRYEKAYRAVIPVPKHMPRLLRLPSEKEETPFILAEDIIRIYLEDFFKGYKVAGAFLFRVVRDSELSVDEEFTSDLLKAIETEVKKRPKAKITRLEIEPSFPKEMLETLCLDLDFPQEEATVQKGDFDLTYLFELIPQAAKPALCYPSMTPAKLSYENIFARINEGDFLLHLPFQSFEPTVDLLQQAARDPDVLGIKMTLYRADEDSRIIKALKEAAKNKKQVTVLVEIKARFDEEKNILRARELEEAGCHVIYGMPGMKIHSKMTLVVRKEEGRIRRYVHLSTGNYNENTSRVYTDLGYFTANDDFAKDISDVFNVITGYSMPSRWKRIVSSPHDLRQYFFEAIDREMENHKKNKNGLVFAKMNSLEDVQMIEKLYEASNAGVKIRLLVRGICCLIPGVKDLSENIKVRSIVGRFLEHSRIYLFNNNGSPQVFLSSADWMTRNLDRRIELLFEVYKDDLKEHLRQVMDIYWKDTAKARLLSSDKTYSKPKDPEELNNAQETLIRLYTA